MYLSDLLLRNNYAMSDMFGDHLDTINDRVSTMFGDGFFFSDWFTSLEKTNNDKKLDERYTKPQWYWYINH